VTQLFFTHHPAWLVVTKDPDINHNPDPSPPLSALPRSGLTQPPFSLCLVSSRLAQDCGIVRDGETIYFAIAPPAAALGGGSGPVLRTYGLLAPPKRLVRSLKQVGGPGVEGRNNGV